MLKATEIKGKKVIDIQSGEKLASIAELVFNPKEKKLEAYVVDTEGILSDQKILRFANVHAHGPDAVTIKEHSSLEKKSQVTKHLSSLANQKTTPLKTNVVTSDGKKIGSVKELYFS